MSQELPDIAMFQSDMIMLALFHALRTQLHVAQVGLLA